MTVVTVTDYVSKQKKLTLPKKFFKRNITKISRLNDESVEVSKKLLISYNLYNKGITMIGRQNLDLLCLAQHTNNMSLQKKKSTIKKNDIIFIILKKLMKIFIR